VDYSPSMRKTLERGTNAGMRPSGHSVAIGAFRNDNGGAIPHSVLVAANTASNTPYLRRCREAGIEPHPARLPEALPEFAIRLTTDPGEIVLDPFAGSCTTLPRLSALGDASSRPIAAATTLMAVFSNSPPEINLSAERSNTWVRQGPILSFSKRSLLHRSLRRR